MYPLFKVIWSTVAINLIHQPLDPFISNLYLPPRPHSPIYCLLVPWLVGNSYNVSLLYHSGQNCLGRFTWRVFVRVQTMQISKKLPIGDGAPRTQRNDRDDDRTQSDIGCFLGGASNDRWMNYFGTAIFGREDGCQDIGSCGLWNSFGFLCRCSILALAGWYWATLYYLFCPLAWSVLYQVIRPSPYQILFSTAFARLRRLFWKIPVVSRALTVVSLPAVLW